MAKLYDDDEALDNEMKVFDYDKGDSADEGQEESKINKRASKASDKKVSKIGSRGKSSEVSANKINRLVSIQCVCDKSFVFRNSMQAL